MNLEHEADDIEQKAETGLVARVTAHLKIALVIVAVLAFLAALAVF